MQTVKLCFYLYYLLFCLTASHLLAASNPLTTQDPNLLSLTDRGSVTNTPYTIQKNAFLLELGYQYQFLQPSGSLYNAVQPTLFYGLSSQSELILTPPTHYQMSSPALSGISATSLGIKQELVERRNWATALEVITTLPDGSATWGSSGVGVTLNEIFLYHLTSKLDVTVMLGESSLTDPRLDGGARFSSINPSVSLSFELTDKLSIFAEGFAETKTSAYQGDNENIDYGLLYLIHPNVVFDIEMGQQLSHQSGLFKQFINTGLSVLF
jgi:hypothetical protein